MAEATTVLQLLSMSCGGRVQQLVNEKALLLVWITDFKKKKVISVFAICIIHSFPPCFSIKLLLVGLALMV